MQWKFIKLQVKDMLGSPKFWVEKVILDLIRLTSINSFSLDSTFKQKPTKVW